MHSFYIDNKKANFKPVSTQMITIPEQALLQAFFLINKTIYSKMSLTKCQCQVFLCSLFSSLKSQKSEPRTKI